MDSPRIFRLPSPQGDSASKNPSNWPFRVTGFVLFLFAPSTPYTHCEFAALSPAHPSPLAFSSLHKFSPSSRPSAAGAPGGFSSSSSREARIMVPDLCCRGHSYRSCPMHCSLLNTYLRHTRSSSNLELTNSFSSFFFVCFSLSIFSSVLVRLASCLLFWFDRGLCPWCA